MTGASCICCAVNVFLNPDSREGKRMIRKARGADRGRRSLLNQRVGLRDRIYVEPSRAA